MKPWIPPTALLLALSPLLVVHPVRVSGRSMEPAQRHGDLRVALRAWISHTPRRGEIWVVQSPQGPSIKRVIGLPGDTVRWNGPDLFINGQRLEEPWVTHPEHTGQGEVSCGEGYLVLGDHRSESEDGRRWGSLPRRAFKGRMM